MKKLFIVLFFLLYLVSSALAVESITWTNNNFKTYSGKKWVEITSTITTAADGTVTSTLLGGTAGGTDTPYDVKGLYLFCVCAGDNGTNPTDNTDLYLRQTTSTGKDVLGLAGENIIDIGSSIDSNCVRPVLNAVAGSMPIFGPLYQVISGNSANSAQIIVKYYFIEQY